MSVNRASALILCGPSGSGKSTLLIRLFEDFPESFGFSVSHTTRKPRIGEQNGVHYHFTDVEDMKRQISDGKFIEHATFGGNLYGTSYRAVKDVYQQGKTCVLDIDVQGVKQVKQTDLNPWYVFIKPPSLTSLEERLRARKTESEESLALRLKVAAEEIEFGEDSGNFDVIIVNDNLDRAYDKLKTFITTNVLKNI